MYYVITINGLASCAVIFLLIATLRKSNKSLTDYALLGIFAAELGWLVSDGLGFVLAVRFGFISGIHGGITGTMIILQVYFIYLFCEFYPRGPLLPYFRLRLALVTLTALPLSAIAFTPLWIVNRRVVNGVKAGDPGQLFSLLPAWAIAVIFTGLFVMMLRARTMDQRSKRNTYIFAVAVLINMALALLVSYVLVYFGIYQFNFLGPVTCVVLVSSILYGINFYHLADMKTLIIRYGIHIFVGLAIGLSFFAYASTLFDGFIAGFLAFFLGIGYYRMVRPRIETLLAPARPRKERVVAEMLAGRLFDVRHLSLNDLLSEILRITLQRLDVESGVILVTGLGEKPIVQARGGIGEPPADGLRPLIRLAGRRLPEFALGHLDAVFLIEETESDFEPRNSLRMSGFRRRYPRTGRALHRTFQRLTEAGFTLLAPLISNREAVGYLVLAGRRGGRLYYQEDVELLDAIRTAAAVLIRNWKFYAEVRERNVEVEAEVTKLSRIVTGGDPVYQQVDERTLVFRSSAMEKILEHCEQAAGAAGQSVLILGETGTGKELISRHIHTVSTPDAPFVAVNCAAVPATLWEADLFGHLRGSFTDAREDREGRIAQASGGTLFFDEIGEMPLEMQAKMLRLLQERSYYPIGSNKPMRADCRFIFATNCDLEDMISRGTFRQDLYYRMNVFRIHIPALRERPEDLPPIANYLIEKLAADLGSKAARIEPGAMNALLNYDWPGNTRELENVLTRACAAASGDRLKLSDLPDVIKEEKRARKAGASVNMPVEPPLLTGNYRFLVNEYRKSLILAALRKARGNKTRAAELLGIKRTTLNGQISELGISV